MSSITMKTLPHVAAIVETVTAARLRYFQSLDTGRCDATAADDYQAIVAIAKSQGLDAGKLISKAAAVGGKAIEDYCESLGVDISECLTKKRLALAGAFNADDIGEVAEMLVAESLG